MQAKLISEKSIFFLIPFLALLSWVKARLVPESNLVNIHAFLTAGMTRYICIHALTLTYVDRYSTLGGFRRISMLVDCGHKQTKAALTAGCKRKHECAMLLTGLWEMRRYSTAKEQGTSDTLGVQFSKSQPDSVKFSYSSHE
jgi:hypothetical protein